MKKKQTATPGAQSTFSNCELRVTHDRQLRATTAKEPPHDDAYNYCLAILSGATPPPTLAEIMEKQRQNTTVNTRTFQPRFKYEWICLNQKCRRLFNENPGDTCPQCHGAVCVRVIGLSQWERGF